MVAITPTAIAYRRCFDAGASDADAGRDIGEPDVDPRDFEDYLADYVRDAYAVLQTTPARDPLTTAYRAGLHDAAVELLTRYHQESTDDLPW